MDEQWRRWLITYIENEDDWTDMDTIHNVKALVVFAVSEGYAMEKLWSKASNFIIIDIKEI